MFGYEIFPLEFDLEVTRSVPVHVLLGTEPGSLSVRRWDGFDFLGYDAVSGRAAITGSQGVAPMMAGFDCSPLSCNAQAQGSPVNRHCLLDRWEDAVAFAVRFAKEEPEPGPYYLFGVYECKS